MDSKPCYNLNDPFEYDMTDFNENIEDRYVDMLIDQLHDIAEQTYEYKFADPS
tara:strand:+ start:136 stop:294 length:159 start_codon:yes stop_codon:yes gene_type:complete